LIGQTLGHYEIKSLLGEGGMGQVYRAHDQKLGRDVALKLLPDEVSRDPERLARFEREAKVLASLNHPGIAALFDLENIDGRVFLTMELAEGEDLSRRLQRGPVPVAEALGLALQIAEALEAAHAKGIVHRDLKPANVMVLENGRVKLLDFGLARAYQGDEASGDPTTSPTITAAMTRQGVILGTAAYMSPEQARGKSVDKQTDVWAFGVLLYEMLTGQRLFDGETVSDSIGAILHKGPDWALLPEATPRPVRRLLRRCLQRDRAHRLRDIGDAIVELRDEEPESADTSAAVPSVARAGGRAGRIVPWAVAVVTIAIAAAIFLTRGGGEQTLPLRKLTVVPIPGSDSDEANGGRLSPDGRRVAYRSEKVLWVRDLDETTPRRLSDAKGFGGWVSTWSPDSRWLAFVNDDKIWKVAMDGSAPTPICEIPLEDRFIAGAWDARDRIILGKWRGGLLEVPAGGGTIRELMKAPDELVDYHALSLLPDGVTLLGSAHLLGDSSRVDVIRDGKIIRSIILSDGSAGDASFAPSGHVVFSEMGRGVWAVPFSLDELDKTGEPFVIDSDGGDPSVALDGSLVYTRNANRVPGRMVRVGMSGNVIGTIGEPGESIDTPLFSPSGSVLAYTADEKGDPRLWTLDLQSGATRQVTQSNEEERACSWSADGRQLLVARAVESNWSSPDNGLYLADIAKGGVATRVGDGRWGQLLPDGGGVLYWRFGVRNDDRLEWKAFEDGAEPKRFVESMKRALMPALSPDGRLVAFSSDDSGTNEVWVARFPGGEGLVQLSRGGGGGAVWSRDGRFLYYRSSGSIYQVTVTGDDPVHYGAPKRLFDGKPEKLEPGAGFDVLPNDSGFVMIQRLPLEDAAIVYVQNWVSEFERRR